MDEALSERLASDWLMRTGCGAGEGSRVRRRRMVKDDWERARETLRRDSSVSSPPGAWDAECMQPILSMLRLRSLSSDVLSRVLVRVSESDKRPPIIDENDLPQAEPPFLPLLGDLAAPGSWELVRSRALTRSWDAWAPRVCGDTFGEEVSKDHERRGVLGREVGVCASEVLLRERGEKSGVVGVGEAMVETGENSDEEASRTSSWPSGGEGSAGSLRMLGTLEPLPLLEGLAINDAQLRLLDWSAMKSAYLGKPCCLLCKNYL